MSDNALRGPPSDLDAIRSRVAQQYPALAPHLANTAIQWGDPSRSAVSGGQLEFYPAWESENPNPGKTTLELYNPRMQGNALQSAIAGDMLHHLGSIDPRTGQPIDPQWRAMRGALINSLTPQQLAVDQRAYQGAQQEGETRPFNQWMDQSRADAYVRGHITPDAADQWKDVYTPEQRNLLGSMKNYLMQPPVSPQNMPPGNALGQIVQRGVWAQ